MYQRTIGKIPKVVQEGCYKHKSTVYVYVDSGIRCERKNAGMEEIKTKERK